MPNTVMGVLVIVAFVIPGFISRQVISFAYPSNEPGEGRLVLEALALSSINYAALSWLLILTIDQHWYAKLAALVIVVLFILLVSPVALGLLFIWVSDSTWIQEIRVRFGMSDPVPKAWDSFFRRRTSCWVLATLKNGKLVGGLYGPNSSASSFPAEEDIYLEKLCRVSSAGRFEGVVAT
ncbi:MAG: DUF6338 family protein [Candidatus Acidiferrales bacterium]